MSFSLAIEKEQTFKTENGAKAYDASLNSVLNLFSKIGSSRGTVLTKEFKAALQENEELAIRTLLWSRDILQGSGERKQFRELMKVLDLHNSELAQSLIPKIPELGRWDDLLYSFSTSKSISKAIDYFIEEGLKKQNGLAAKWAPRENSANKGMAISIAKKMGLTPKQYRKYISNLTNVVEQQMCANKWEDIVFSHVPSKASLIYRKAFYKHQEQRYTDYVASLVKGTTKINSKTLMPYELVKQSLAVSDSVLIESIEQQWKALPDLLDGTKILPMIDVSGSMTCPASQNLSCMDVAISLGMYISERNKSVFKDLMVTFSSVPTLFSVDSSTHSLRERYIKIRGKDWGMSTNISAAIKAILDLAIKHNLKQSDMPEMLVVLSDMQFDPTKFHSDESSIKELKKLFKSAGYKVPKVVFWNLNGTYGRDTSPVKPYTKKTCYVSGFSPNILKAVLSNNLETFTPINVMLETLNSERYNYK